MEYKHFHEGGDPVFHCEEKVWFSRCSSKSTLSLNETLRMLSDAAVEDYNLRGMSREILQENGYGILVSRCSFRFHKWPEENSRIEIVTWEEKSEALQLCRAYKILDENGAELVSGKSTWVVIDINARRIIPSKKFTLRPPVERFVELDCMQPGKISGSEDAVLVDSRVIRNSDLDGNGHTNNARYAAFIEDAMPEEFRGKNICDFKINFSQEAVLGDKINLYMSKSEGSLVFVGKTEKAVSFEAQVWFSE